MHDSWLGFGHFTVGLRVVKLIGRFGLNLGWGGPMGDYMGFWGHRLRDILQIQSRAHVQMQIVIAVGSEHRSE